MRLLRLIVWRALLLVILLPAGLVAPTGCGCDLEVTNGGLPEGLVGVSYFFQLNSTCGGNSWFIQSGTLPPGIGLLDDGDLTGFPSTPGIFPFTVGVVDFDTGNAAFKGFAITINPAPTPTPLI